MYRPSAYPNGYAANKRDDGEAFSIYPHRSDMENKFIWNLPDLQEDEVADALSSRSFQPRQMRLHQRNRILKLLGLGCVLTFFGIVLLHPSLRSHLPLLGVAAPAAEHFEIETLRYYDLETVQGTSRGWEREERVLLCTPLRDAEEHLRMFFNHLRNFTYPHHLIDLAFLVSDSKDNTEGLLTQLLEELQADSDPKQPYGEISVIHKDFGQKVNQDVESRHGFAAQASRRKLMAQARNWLMYSALRPTHSWVYWRDADVETAPVTLIEDLMRHDKDVIVPNVWRPLPDWLGGEQPYDLNSWQESETALALAETLDEDAVIVEGYAEYATWRPHLAYLRDPYGDPDMEMEIDGVGGVSILAKARVFRAGVHFPAFSFEKHAETEGFGKMAKRMGFSVVGLPHYTVWHLYEPSEQDLQHMQEMEEERNARAQEEREREERMKKIKEEFKDPNSQWEKDKAGIAEKTRQEKEAAEKNAAEKEAAEKETAEKEAVDKKAADEKATDKKAADRNAANKKFVDEKGADKNVVDKKATDKKSGDKKGAEKQAVAGKGVAEKKATAETKAEQAKSKFQPADSADTTLKSERSGKENVIPNTVSTAENHVKEKGPPSKKATGN